MCAMSTTGFLRALLMMFGLTLFFASTGTCQDFQKSGILYYNCILPTYFDFSRIPDSCVDKTCIDYRFTDTSGRDLTFAEDTLRASVGIYSFGTMVPSSFYDTATHSVINPAAYSVPDSLFGMKAKYGIRDLYIVKTREGGRALLSETDNFIGACYKLNFIWALDTVVSTTLLQEDASRAVTGCASLFRIISVNGRPVAVYYTLSIPVSVKLDVYSASGAKVLAKKFSHACAGSFAMPLDVRFLPAGVYFLGLLAGNRSETKRIPIF
jgi:hypothetical protein